MKRTFVNDNFFLEIDCELKAYLLGFFLADGYIRMNARCKNSFHFGIALMKRDEYVIQWFHDFICPFRTIGHAKEKVKNGASHQASTNIAWTSTKMKEYMESIYGIKERKTYDVNYEFPFDKIPEEFKWDFIRGVFDGDGQISYSKTNHASTFGIYTTSKKFANQLGDIFESEFKTKIERRVEGTKKSNMVLYLLRFTAFFKKKKFYREIYEKFYSGKKYFLKRKEEKFKDFLLYQFRANPEEIKPLLDSVERSE